MTPILIAALAGLSSPAAELQPIDLTMKTVGVVAPSRGGMPRCRWTATVAGPSGSQKLAGERPGDCLIHRAAIAREVQARTAR